MPFWSGVAEDVVADAIVVAGAGVLAAGAAFLKFSGAVERIGALHPTRPDRAVIEASEHPLGPLVRSEPSPFTSPLSPHERDDLVSWYLEVNATKAWDGPVVRLDRIHPSPAVSVVGFFDLITTNLTAFPANVRLGGHAARVGALAHWVKLRPSIAKVRDAARLGGRRPTSAGEVLSNSHLANALAVSVLAVDPSGLAMVTRRSAQVAVSSGRWAATAGGTVSVSDLGEADPIRSAAAREMEEETGISGAEMAWAGLILPLRKLQPVASYVAELACPAEVVARLAGGARDYGFETSALGVVDITDPLDVVRFCARSGATEAAAWAVWHEASKRCGSERLEAAWARHGRLGLRRWEPRQVRSTTQSPSGPTRRAGTGRPVSRPIARAAASSPATTADRGQSDGSSISMRQIRS